MKKNTIKVFSTTNNFISRYAIATKNTGIPNTNIICNVLKHMTTAYIKTPHVHIAIAPPMVPLSFINTAVATTITRLYPITCITDVKFAPFSAINPAVISISTAARTTTIGYTALCAFLYCFSVIFYLHKHQKESVI